MGKFKMKTNRSTQLLWLTLFVMSQLVMAQGAQGEQNNDDDEPIDPDEAGEDIYDGISKPLFVGKGTAWVIFFCFVGAVFCLFKNCSRYPNLCVCIGFLLPLLVYGIIR